MLRPTIEQQEIIYSEASLIFVAALAGTGKTTTLVELSRYRKSESILYLVYNNSIKEEAKTKFPERVHIHTAHSLAFSVIGVKYSDKIGDNIKVEDIFKEVSFFKDKDLSETENVRIAINISKILNHFLNSDVETIQELNYPDFYKEYVEEYWNKMKDPNNLECLITHDGYLKLFQLSKPKLNYDYIMVDEAQDSNEVMLDIVFRQNSKKIFVGDPNQKIYGFRGALNVFNESKYTSYEHETFYLTESFRFGEGIANIANNILDTYKENQVKVVGTDKDCTINELDLELQYTIIFRTNTGLFDKAIQLVREGKSIHIIGGVDSIFNQILDTYYLYKGELSKIKGNYMKTLNSYQQLKTLSETLKIPEHRFLVRLIENYGDSLFEWIHLIKANLAGKKSADVILTTAHKSKGLEFVSVELASDFVDLYTEDGHLNKHIHEEEINLLYVAVTRAVYDIKLNYDLNKLLGYKHVF